MQLVVISSEVFFKGEPEIINELFEEGMQYFHLRKPGASEFDIVNILSGINTKFHCKISLHDHHYLTDKFEIKRIHLREELRRKSDVNYQELLSDRAYSVSTSVHTLTDLKTLSSDYNYTFLSPVFDSISKTGYRGFSGDQFRISNSWKKTKVIGLGGIADTNITTLKDMNFDGAAVLGFIWTDPSKSISNFKKLKKHAE